MFYTFYFWIKINGSTSYAIENAKYSILFREKNVNINIPYDVDYSLRVSDPFSNVECVKITKYNRIKSIRNSNVSKYVNINALNTFAMWIVL